MCETKYSAYYVSKSMNLNNNLEKKEKNVIAGTTNGI